MAKTVTRKIKRSPGDQLVQVFIYVFVGAFALITLLPFVYIVAGSFVTERELTERAFFLFHHIGEKFSPLKIRLG